MKAAKHTKANARLALAGALVLLALAAAPSAGQAAQLHAFSAAFGSPGSGAGQLSLRPMEQSIQGGLAPGSGLAVNDETSDVYVADTENHRVDEFSPSGTFIRAFGWEVDAEHPEAKLQQCTLASGCQAGSSGHEPGQFERPVFVAVDNSASESKGDVYVADLDDDLVTKFDSEGNLISSWGTGGQLTGSPTLATGTGTTVAGSSQITSFKAESGEFEQAETISGAGIPPGTFRIESHEIASGKLNLSAAATASASNVALSARFTLIQMDGIAVGADGGLSILRLGGLLRFDQAGSYVEFREAFGEALGLGPLGLGLNLDADYFLGEREEVGEFGPTANGAVYKKAGGAITALALAPAAAGEDLYLDEGTAIVVVSHQCEPTLLHGSGQGCLPSQEFGAGHLSEAAGLAVGPDGAVYAANTGPGEIAEFVVSLEANIEAPTEVKARSALLHATLDPEGGEVVTCRFQYGRSTSYGGSLPCLNEAGEEVGTAEHPLTGNLPVALHAEAAGLKAGAAYHFRLRAVNGEGGEIHSEDEEFETLVLPRIEAEEASEIAEVPLGSGEVSAALGAKVNPQGLAVSSCKIEWGASTSYGHAEPCQPSSLPAGAFAEPVGLQLNGLSAETTYHWRVVASDENGAETSPDHTFVFLPALPVAEVSQECDNQSLREANGSTALPDCRAYELVTPPHKNGATVGSIFPSVVTSVARDGQRLLAPTVQCFGGALSCSAVRQMVGSPYEFARSASGWQARPLTTEASQFTGSTTFAMSADAPEQLLSVVVPGSPPSPGREWFYGLGSGGSLSPIGPVAPEPGNFFRDWFSHLAATADLSHLVYTSEPSLWPSFDASQAGRESVYEYAGAASQPFLVAVSGGVRSTDLLSTCGSSLVTQETNMGLSADGRTVYFEVLPCATGSGANAGVAVPARTIYARIDGESPDARTVNISAPAPEPACDSACQARPPAAASFLASSSDGSMAYFTSTGQLTNEATQGSQNLYLYRDPQEEPAPAGNHLTDVSAGDTSGQGPQVQGVMEISPDGSHAYFVAKGLLAGENAEGVEPREGADNLYVYDAGEGKTHFIATLPGSSACTGGSSEACQREEAQWLSSSLFTANVTSDGRYLLFTSCGALTPDATREVGPAQVYRYDAVSQALARVSIGRSGFNDDGNAGSGPAAIANAAQQIVTTVGRPRLNPSMSADGSRVFFESPVGLTPGALNDVAINGRGGLAMNVYEWEQEGVDGCTQRAGCVYLISDGRDATESPVSQSSRGASSVELLGTDEAGENVFFATADQLVAGDADTGRDLYDARVGGGFAPSPRSEPCESTEACHGEVTTEAPFSSPATLVFNGLGNIALPITPTPKPKPKPLTRARLLAKALKVCRTKHNRHKRVACEHQARKRYGPPHKATSRQGGK